MLKISPDINLFIFHLLKMKLEGQLFFCKQTFQSLHFHELISQSLSEKEARVTLHENVYF